MSRKTTVFGVVLLVVVLAVGGWVWYGKKDQTKDRNTSQEPQKQIDASTNEVRQSQQEFVTDVDMNIDHWQTKETEFFTIKFPKEWYWLELTSEKNGARGSYVISNNQHFPLDSYRDIEWGTGGNYPLILMNDSEIVITVRGWATTNAGTPHDFLESEINRIKKYVNSSAECYYVSDINSTPLTAWCSFIDVSNQRVQTYYLSNTDTTLGFTARTTENNNTLLENTLEKIAKSYTF